MSDPATLAFYEQQAPQYTASTAQMHHRHLDPFLTRLADGAHVLELGCGAGRDAARMIEHGFVVDATDAAAAMVRKAQERFGIAARQMRFDDLCADSEYDAVWAHACLIHVARADFPAVLAAINRALRPGGWHFANYKLGDGEGRDLLGRLHNFPSAEWLTAAYFAAGFEIVETESYPGQGADGTQRDWIAMTLRKA
ncbi:class I SAM-dependent methyltransferase [Qipengyuania marisflavi]|uniref:Class I SAM-dependent methyltransferase n=1 Tax=Qipengyuania marisflavi TaxID=2486356 RepID=A0A5S3P9J1_9SPHN|nr:class I SAM-dependent methyltransferase [Qipengyuania marisflavi]TMM50179.1 class I SAM-dependent methyltransferase [Qipengyuania marisflavi]